MRTIPLVAGAICLFLALLAFVLNLDFLAYTIGSVQVNIYAGAALLMAGIVLMIFSLQPKS